jgi:putrescine transport system substrate-binding protein
VKSNKSLYVAMTLALGLNISGAIPLHAQGMISAPPSSENMVDEGLGALAKTGPQEISTIQRLLRRLGYLKDDNMTREMDEGTVSALLAYFKDVNTSPNGMSADRAMRSLFTTAWNKEGWATGNVNGQDLVVEPAEVRIAQTALAKLKYAPGPVDGVFGPATFSAVETFQEDDGMKVTGLLTRNTFQNITRAIKFVDRPAASVVHVLNWPDYIDPDSLDKFEQETNIRVVHEVFQNTSETKELLAQGSSNYDMMVQPGAQMRQVLETENAVEVLDGLKIPNSKNLDPAATKYTGVLDPGSTHSIPFMWGTVGIGINQEKIKEISPNAPTNSMALFLDPAIAANLSKCGIAVIDEPNDVIPTMVAYLGGDIKSISTTDLEAVDAALSKVSQYIKVVSLESYIDSFADGKYCVVFGYSGDIFLARDSAKEKKKGTIVYKIPKDGSQLFFDLLVIPSHASNKDGAYQLINFMLKPEIAAENTNFVQYANANLASAPFINPSLLADPGLYPPQNTLKRLAVLPPLTISIDNELKRIWAKLKKE